VDGDARQHLGTWSNPSTSPSEQPAERLRKTTFSFDGTTFYFSSNRPGGLAATTVRDTRMKLVAAGSQPAAAERKGAAGRSPSEQRYAGAEREEALALFVVGVRVLSDPPTGQRAHRREVWRSAQGSEDGDSSCREDLT